VNLARHGPNSKVAESLIVCCGLGRTMLLLTELSPALMPVPSNPRSDSIRRMDHLIPRTRLRAVARPSDMFCELRVDRSSAKTVAPQSDP
jgi:hypothetical protein